MPPSDRAGVLAIGLDAAQAPLVRQLVDRGEMPSLAALLEHGSWSRVPRRARCGIANRTLPTTILAIL